MIEQNVQVVRCGEQRIWVRLGSQTGCPACDSGKGCGAGIFASLLQRRPEIIELTRRNVEVRPGQMVTLAFSERIYLKMVLAYYGWPLLAALGGALAGFALARWLLLGALWLDATTLAGGVLAGSMVVLLLKKRQVAQSVLNSLQMAVYYPSETPNMCSSEMNQSAQS